MNHRKADGPDAPSPELLAAYVDGEMDARTRARVEAWLADHAEARDEVRGLQRLQKLCADAPPPEPGERTWSAALARIEAHVAEARLRPARHGSRWLVRLGLVAGCLAAGCLLLIAFSLRGLRSPPGPEPVLPLPVASDHDIEILSMEDSDIAALIVGKPPILGELVLASAEDISEIETAADENGQLPEHWGKNEGLNGPMIVSPLTKSP